MLLAAAAVAALVMSHVSSPLPSQAGPLLVVQTSPRGADDEIATMHADGTGLRYLTHNRFDDLQPSFSPDRTAIVFTRTGPRSGVYVLRLPREVMRLTHGDDSAPTFSPTGDRIAFVRGSTLMTMRVDGTGLHALARAPGSPRQLSWSPDGSTLLFAGDYALRLVSVASGGTTTIPVAGAYDAFRPIWSPDGTRIAFLSYFDERYPGDLAAWGIFIVPRAGGTAHRFATGKFGPLSWAADGSIVASSGYELALFAPDGTMTDLPVRGRWASFVPGP
jgi:Tol biopolymer transport system component